MTGFGRGEATAGGTAVSVEVSSVNRKQGEINLTVPRELAGLEPGLRETVAAACSRGRVSVKVSLDSGRGTSAALRIDYALADEYLRELAAIGGRAGVAVGVTAADLLRAPGVFVVEDAAVDAGVVKPLAEAALGRALEAWDAMRRAEGEALLRDLETRIDELGRLAGEVRALAPSVARRYRDNLLRRLREGGLGIDLDDERVLKEVGLFAERCDITEELTRLDSHLAQFRGYLRREGPAGREMDFLAQELHREINTIGAKGNDAEIAGLVVAAKAETERVREQVQNVE
jgi:uncharacterized protein (TIGR00255 family)